MGSRKGVRTLLKLDPLVAEKLAELAEAQRRSRTAVVEVAIEEMYDREKAAGRVARR